jgi:hypothetical protein
MKNLIPMTYFVLEQKYVKQSTSEFKEVILKYAFFLNQPLKLEMFVPCDEDGNILEEPEFFYKQENLKDLKGMKLLIAEETNKRVSEYQKAKEKVIFEGFTLYPNNDNFLQKGNILIDISKLRTVEDLIPYNLELKNEILLF